MKPKRAAPGTKSAALTTPDLVLLSLLAEHPFHGYEANAELERREVRDWAGISRPQVYYSLEKLARLGWIRAVENDERGAGPERRSFATTARGRNALAEALEREEWALGRERPPFLTWIALSWQARAGVFEQQTERRRRFLQAELARERMTLRAIRREVGHRFHEAVWMVTLAIRQLQVELRWLDEIERELPQRRGAQKPPAKKPLAHKRKLI